MNYYTVTRDEYLQLLRSCTSLHHTHMFSHTQSLIMDLLDVNTYAASDTFDIPEKLMHRIAIANMCDRSLEMHHDSCGEIDFAGLNERSTQVLNDILRTI